MVGTGRLGRAALPAELFAEKLESRAALLLGTGRLGRAAFSAELRVCRLGALPVGRGAATKVTGSIGDLGG